MYKISVKSIKQYYLISIVKSQNQLVRNFFSIFLQWRQEQKTLWRENTKSFVLCSPIIFFPWEHNSREKRTLTDSKREVSVCKIWCFESVISGHRKNHWSCSTELLLWKNQNDLIRYLIFLGQAFTKQLQKVFICLECQIINDCFCRAA